MTLLRAAIALLGLALLGVVAWAAFALTDLHGGFLDQFSVVATLPWGVAALADLYVGFILFSVIVFLTERSWIVAAIWAAPIFVLGNVWAALWLVVRLPHLIKNLRTSWPNS